jgi:acetolactate synthase-1/3 small subunit
MGSEDHVCITITVFANKSYMELIVVKLGLLDHVHKVYMLANKTMFYQKLALFKMDTGAMLSNPLLQNALFNREFKVVEINPKFMIISTIGDDAKLENLYNSLKPYGVLNWVQSGMVPIAIEDQTINRG